MGRRAPIVPGAHLLSRDKGEWRILAEHIKASATATTLAPSLSEIKLTAPKGPKGRGTAAEQPPSEQPWRHGHYSPAAEAFEPRGEGLVRQETKLAAESGFAEPPRRDQQRRNRAVVERNNAAIEQGGPELCAGAGRERRGGGPDDATAQHHPRPRLYDRVRKRAPRLSHGGTTAQLPPREQQFWTRLARPARAEQKAATAAAIGLASSSLRPLRPASAGAKLELAAVPSPTPVSGRRARSASSNAYVPKKTRRKKKKAGVGDLAQNQMAAHAAQLEYRGPDPHAEDPDYDPTRGPLDPPAFDPQTNLAPKQLR